MNKANILKNTALILVSLLFACAGGEIVLRVMGFSYPNFYVTDPFTGMKLRPNAEGWYREEGEAYVRVNSLGMRDDREINVEKSSGTFRIAVLGDSYVEALQIPTEDTFPVLVEKKLNQCEAFKGRKVEVLNFGVSGYSTAQELLTLQHRVWPFSPDLVMLTFLAGNDLRDNSKEISGSYPRPFFSEQNGKLQLDESFRDSAIYRMKSSQTWEFLQTISKYSRLLQLVNKVKNVLGQPLSAPADTKKNAGEHQAGLDDLMFLPPSDARWKNAWDITERLLQEVSSEVAQHKSKFLLVDITNGIDVNPDVNLKNKYMKEIGVADLNYPHNRLENFAARNNMDFLGLQPVFADKAVKNNEYFHGFANTRMGYGHWNKAGHLLAAETIAAHICSAAGR